MSEARFVIESEDVWEEGAIVSVDEHGKVRIAVAEEKAVDSYNESFTCTVTMDKAKALELAGWILKNCQ